MHSKIYAYKKYNQSVVGRLFSHVPYRDISPHTILCRKDTTDLLKPGSRQARDISPCREPGLSRILAIMA